MNTSKHKILLSEIFLSATIALVLIMFTSKLLLPMISYSWAHRNLDNWSTTQAQLHSLQIVSHTKRTGSQSYKISPFYTYNFEGESYNGNELSYPSTTFVTAYAAKQAIKAYFPQWTNLIWKNAYSWDPDSLAIVNPPASIQVRYYPNDPKYSLLVINDKVRPRLLNDIVLLFLITLTTGFVLISGLWGLLSITSLGVWIFQFFESDRSVHSKHAAWRKKVAQNQSLKADALFKPGKNADFLSWAEYGAGLCARKQYTEALSALDRALQLSPGECGTTGIETEIALQQCECLIALGRNDQARARLESLSIYFDNNRFEDLAKRALEFKSRLDIDKPAIQKESPLFELE